MFTDGEFFKVKRFYTFFFVEINHLPNLKDVFYQLNYVLKGEISFNV